MTTILTVLEIVAPVFLLAAIGFGWVRMGIDYPIRFVTQLGMTLSVPCLIFVALMEADVDPSTLSDLTMASLTAYGAVSLVMALLVWGGRLDMRSYLSPLIFGNTGNLGLPLALFAFGADGLTQAIVILAIMTVLNFSLGVWVVAGGGNVLKVLREPLVGATLLGGLFLWQDWQTPEFLTNTLRLIGQMAIPLMLITLGVAVAGLRPRGISRALVLSALKLGICAGLAWMIGRWFGLPPVAFGALVLQVSTPVAVTSYMLAEKYGADSEAVAGLVVVSTLLSVLCLPILLALLL